ncbi:MAG: hypothetical protein DDT19_01894 [Syntrophomonadaceae bacterium]|nr:hypothetical protein [Bacillota bacterium]
MVIGVERFIVALPVTSKVPLPSNVSKAGENKVLLSASKNIFTALTFSGVAEPSREMTSVRSVASQKASKSRESMATFCSATVASRGEIDLICAVTTSG